MRNVTLTLPDEVALRARVWAAEADTSLSAFLCRLLTEKMENEADYRRASGDFFSRQPVILQETPSPYPTRDELPDRAGLR
ncbi:MAG: hypothetical protein NTW21_04045 [Verrucomicrobia bacterium]|nr:hypothetical protein [Verrucomicrobiota bacterium]